MVSPPPPPLLRFQCLRLTANICFGAKRMSASNFRFGGGHREEGGSQPNPPAPPPPLPWREPPPPPPQYCLGGSGAKKKFVDRKSASNFGPHH